MVCLERLLQGPKWDYVADCKFPWKRPIPMRALVGGFQVGGHRRGLYEFGVCLNGKGQLPAC